MKKSCINIIFIKFVKRSSFNTLKNKNTQKLEIKLLPFLQYIIIENDILYKIIPHEIRCYLKFHDTNAN